MKPAARPLSIACAEPLAVSEGLLYRRGNFNGSFDQLILEALLQEKNAEIAFSPGFRWGTSILPGDTISFEQVMEQTAITYPMTTVTEMSGENIKAVLEDVCDNLFNPDPYYQQGGDMVRVGGMSYTCEPAAAMGSRIGDMRLHGAEIDAWIPPRRRRPKGADNNAQQNGQYQRFQICLSDQSPFDGLQQKGHGADKHAKRDARREF